VRLLPLLLKEKPARKRYYSAACLAGMLAALLVTLLMGIARGLYLTSVNMALLWGAYFTGELSANTWILGAFLQVAGGALCGSVYALAFHATRTTGYKIGALFGVAHWLLAGTAMGFLPLPFSVDAREVLPPGFFAFRDGFSGACVFFLVHLLFGAIVGEGHGLAVRRYRDQLTKKLPTAA
jgi:hypothetical protein